MDHRRRGIALIFNHERFFWRLGLSDRRGTCADRDNLTRRLSDLGFEVQCFDNLKAKEVLLRILEVSNSSHVDADCFLCVFLSHGKGSHIYAYDAEIEIPSLTELFKGDKCKSLVGKPKIFIIQACRGDKHDVPVQPLDQVDSMPTPPGAGTTEVDAASVYTLPAGADFLMCYSVAEGPVRDAGAVWGRPGVHRATDAGQQEGVTAPGGLLPGPQRHRQEAGALLRVHADQEAALCPQVSVMALVSLCCVPEALESDHWCVGDLDFTGKGR
ncbi:PREDICTED: caspase-6 isoform X1 [Condylura cristata]|uniref:caspase-6 isoform X1 n=1 Tax=Condylura cristata TaxID=143302 RepID=UPI00064331B0|nr:PREDICTED: caspase-6 isoform X1 [Condylura cristata]